MDVLALLYNENPGDVFTTAVTTAAGCAFAKGTKHRSFTV